ncbi:LuxR C-terminal-related transcriptional regulator [Acinetobacter pseudolwoffii]|uniref:LuxR C-terminal-related transcriptional regulator n=1 Tax=Acinetobacter pseudolwoffii TaxID=2053287 RepID=UPI00209AB6C2|nr:LuxR C-terminal-related transcriptional regulator [Acinetobacter pseudolwoffii]MCO8090177.1 LuxR C-terminal-related transcriptional regulator [Acinetobacter pseudolwoffii]
MKLEQENNLIAKIYDAALLPALWLEVIEDIVSYTKSKSAIFTGLDQLNPGYDFVHTYNIPNESLAAYQDERIRVIDMKLHMPLWNDIEMGDALNQNCQHYAERPGTDHYVFYEKCLKPTGVCYLAGVLLDQGHYRWAVLGIHRAPEVQPFEQAELDFLRRISIHLRRALQIHRQISLIQQDNLNLYTLLEGLKTGIVLLDQNLCLSYSNPVAQQMIQQSSCLDLDRHNHLKTHPSQQALEQLLASALLQDVALHTEIGGALALKGPDGQQLMLTAVPFKHFSPTPQLDEARHRIALLITDKNQHYSLSKAYLQQCYRLSNREFELCELLLNAYKLEEIAEHCGITLSSVRTYFKNIYEKTGCNSQIELMHLLMGCMIYFEHIQ